MTELLEMKQQLKAFYAKHDVYLIPAVKFLLALAAFLLMNSQIGFMKRVANPAVALLLALICSFLPVNMIAIFGALMLCAHAYALSLEMAALTAGLLFLMYVIYFRVSSRYGFALVLTPLAFMVKIPYALPLVLGLVGGPAGAVPVGCGTVIYYLMYFMKSNEKMLTSPETEEMSARIQYLVENVLNNKDMILTVLVFAVTLMVVYVVHRLSVDYSWHLALGVGAVSNIVLFLVGALVMRSSVSVSGVILGTLASLLIALTVEFFVFSVDYSRTEYTQFEDDEYYYYVKAVPKMSIAMPEKRVKKINPRKKPPAKKAPRKK